MSIPCGIALSTIFSRIMSDVVYILRQTFYPTGVVFTRARLTVVYIYYTHTLWYNTDMGKARIWNGTESVRTTRRKLKNGDVVRSFGGAFAAKATPLGGVLEKCLAERTWETKYRTEDEYIGSLYEVKS